MCSMWECSGWSKEKRIKRQGLISKQPEIVVSKHLVTKGIFTTIVTNIKVSKIFDLVEIVDPAPKRTVY